ncbi:hypothetical protein D3C85_1606940 [compost metagenome]
MNAYSHCWRGSMISAWIGSVICGRLMRCSLRLVSPVNRFSSRSRLSRCSSLPVAAASIRVEPLRLKPTLSSARPCGSRARGASPNG